MEYIFLMIATACVTFFVTWYLLKKKDQKPELTDSTTQSLVIQPQNPILEKGFEAFLSPDIYITEVEYEKDMETKKIKDPPFAIDGLLKLIPRAVDLGKRKGTYIVKFSPKISKGLKDGSLAFMKSGGSLKAVVVDKSGKIVGQGMLTSEGLLNPAEGVLLIWEILAIITAQKYLSDINKKLMSIQETVQGLKSWCKAHKDGEFEGNLRYLKVLLKNLESCRSIPQWNQYKMKIEDIFHQSLQAIEGERKVAQNAYEKIYSTEYNGNTEENTLAFERYAQDYYDSVSKIIKLNYLAVLTIYMSSVIDGRSQIDDDRLTEIKEYSEALAGRVETATKDMAKKVDSFESGWLDGEDYIKESKNRLKGNLKKFKSICHDSNKEVIAMSEATKNAKKQFQSELDVVELCIETDEEGNIISYQENKKAIA